MRRLRPQIALLISFLLLAAAGCSEPPQKEIDQAQAAVDLAKNADAERFAADEYTAATTALAKARAAVDQRDYRQALSYAIDARQRAQSALRQAADEKTRVRKAAEALYGEIATRANRLQALLRAADAAHAGSKELREPRATLAEARKALQEASAAISLGNYEQGSKSLTEVRGKLDAAMKDAEKIPQPAPRSGKGKLREPGSPRASHGQPGYNAATENTENTER